MCQLQLARTTAGTGLIGKLSRCAPIGSLNLAKWQAGRRGGLAAENGPRGGLLERGVRGILALAAKGLLLLVCGKPAGLSAR